MSKRKSLKRHIQSNVKTDKINDPQLHLIKGKYEHTHSLAPISASEIETIEAVNPEYVKELFSIMHKSITLEEKEMDRYFNAIEKEQENDKLSIEKQSEDNNNSMKYSIIAIILFMFCGTGLIIAGFPLIGGAMTTTVLLGVARAILLKKGNEEE